MSKPASRFDANSVRDCWDRAADAYTRGQASGVDYYRYELFGPAHVAICGEVKGLCLLDIGCGSGYFAREMAQRGAQVTAIDLSPRMIELASQIEAITPLGIRYQVLDAVELEEAFPRESFDVVTSCVSLDDMPEPAAVLDAVHSLLRPRGRLVATITHPCTDTPYRKWDCDDAGSKRSLCIDRYFDRGPNEYTWPNWPEQLVTTALHATLEDWFEWILNAGFQVRGLREPKPTEQALHVRPDLKDAARVPFFLIFDLVRSS